MSFDDEDDYGTGSSGAGMKGFGQDSGYGGTGDSGSGGGYGSQGIYKVGMGFNPGSGYDWAKSAGGQNSFDLDPIGSKVMDSFDPIKSASLSGGLGENAGKSGFDLNKAQDYAMLSHMSYLDYRQKEDGSWEVERQHLRGGDSSYKELLDRHDKYLLNSGYKVLDHYTDPQTGYSCTAFQKDGRPVLALRGVMPEYLSREMPKIRQIANSQIPEDEMGLASYAMNDLTNRYGSIDLTGHSKGGYYSQILKTGNPEMIGDVYTFNAPGAKYAGLSEDDLGQPIAFNAIKSNSFLSAFNDNRYNRFDDVYNMSATGGSPWLTRIIDSDYKIGREWQTPAFTHGIKEMHDDLLKGNVQPRPSLGERLLYFLGDYSKALSD
jgi:hypothetical protein